VSKRYPSRYVVLRHEGVPDPHFDLMLEDEHGAEKLLTWRSPVWPIEVGTPLERLADHRNAYLDYEGPLSGDRGFVTRVASGWCLVGSGIVGNGAASTLIVFEPETTGLLLRQTDGARWIVDQRVQLQADVLGDESESA
jgi:hypothetical protein